VPALVSAEVHTLPLGQPLPPAPRQPGTQAVLDASQIWPLFAPPQSLSDTQPTQVPALESLDVHTVGETQPLPPTPRQPGPQVLVVASQICPGLGQSASDTHCTQVPALASVEVQTSPVSQPFPPVPRQPSTQVALAASQMWPGLGQSASVLQPTQVPALASVEVQTSPVSQPLPPVPRQPSTQVVLAASQMWPGLGQSASVLQPTQVPALASEEVQTMGDAQPLPPAPRQPGPQVLVEGSQTLPLVASPQSESVLQATHVPRVESEEVQTMGDAHPLPGAA